MSDRLMICIPCKDRREVVEQCLPTMFASKYAGDEVRCYNDGSTEYDAAWLESIGADWAMNFSGMGVDAQRRMHILDFMDRADQFSHLYFSDSDCLVDPHWRERLLEIHERTGAITCGYNTDTHEKYEKNTFRREPGIVWRRFAPGVSMLMSCEQVEKIAASLPSSWSFDWHIPGLFNYRCAISDTSCVDHLGAGGSHDLAEPGHVSPERALNPTSFLIEKRKEVLAKLGLKEHE